jgi:hypothetical protein
MGRSTKAPATEPGRRDHQEARPKLSLAMSGQGAQTRKTSGGRVMTRTGTILKAMQAVLLVTVLIPATAFAGSLSHPATQTQAQPASGEVKHVSRGLILTPAEAATSAPVAPQVEIPPLPPRHDEAPAGQAANNSYSTAAAPAQTTSTAQTSSITTLPAPAQLATETPAPATSTATDAATAPAPVAPVAPAVTTVQTPPTVAAPAATPAPATATANITTTPANTKTTTTPAGTTQASHQGRSHHHSDDSFNVSGFNISSGNIERQATKFFNRRDVKSALRQFGFN